MRPAVVLACVWTCAALVQAVTARREAYDPLGRTNPAVAHPGRALAGVNAGVAVGPNDEVIKSLLQAAGVTTFSYGVTASPDYHFSPQNTRVFPFTCAPAEGAGPVANMTMSLEGAQVAGPSPMVTRRSDELFTLVGSTYGHLQTARNMFVAKINVTTMVVLWNITLDDDPNSWHLDDAISLAANGDLIVLTATYVFLIDADDGEILKKVELPIPPKAARGDVAYRSMSFLSDGNIITRSSERPAGCIYPHFFSYQCIGKNLTSYITILDGKTLNATQVIPIEDRIAQRITSGIGKNGREYIYSIETGGALRRYLYSNGKASLDEKWVTAPLEEKKTFRPTTYSGIALMNGWVLTAGSYMPAMEPVSLVAIWEEDPKVVHTIQPFKDVELAEVEVIAGPADDPGLISWSPSSLAADPASNTVFITDAVVGQIVAYRLTAGGFTQLWNDTQVTLWGLNLIGEPDRRVVVSTNMWDVRGRFTTGNLGMWTELLQFRDAATGEVLFESPANGWGGHGHIPGFPGAYFSLGAYVDKPNTLLKVSFPVDEACKELMESILAEPTLPIK